MSTLILGQRPGRPMTVRILHENLLELLLINTTNMMLSYSDDVVLTILCRRLYDAHQRQPGFLPSRPGHRTTIIDQKDGIVALEKIEWVFGRRIGI